MKCKFHFFFKAHDRDRGRKSKKGRKSARKAAKKSKRGRKEKDLTPDRSLESLIEELVQSGIIRSYPKGILHIHTSNIVNMTDQTKT